MKKILPKMLTLIFVGALVITSALNIDRILQAQAHSLSGNVNELGIDSSVSYSFDNTSAALSIDMSSLDTEKYEVKQILGPNGEVLDLISPSVNVSDNGDYLIKVQYIDKTAVVEVTPEETVAPVEEAAPVVEEVVEEPAPVTVVEPEIKEIELTTHVNEIVIVGTQTKEEVVSNPVLEDVPQASAASPRAVSKVNLNDIFDSSVGMVNNSVLWKDSKNINPSIEGDTIKYYDAKANGEIPTRRFAGNVYSSDIVVPSRSKVSMKANWTFEGKAKIASTNLNYWNTAGIILRPDRTVPGNYVSISLGMVPEGSMIQTDKNAVFTRKVISSSQQLYNNETEVTIKNKYNSSNGQSIVTISVLGNTTSINVTSLGDYVDFDMSGSVAWLNQSNYPVNIPSYFTFSNFQYDNFNPQFENLKWFDSKGLEVTKDSQVKPGDELTVKANVKNGSDTTDAIPAKIFLSDDQTLAATKGVEAIGDIIAGVPVTLSKNAQEVTFKVKVKDTIGDISLGVQLEDDFFHQKQYRQVTSNISVGEIFADGSPTYTVMEYGRDDLGTIMQDGFGNPIYVEAANQNLLTQDSFVKVAGMLENPRVNEELTALVKADLSKVPGLDYDHVQDLEVVNGTGTSLADGLSFTLAANKGTGSFSYVVPVKQNADGTPFNSDEQAIDYTIDGSFVHASEGPVAGTWLKSDVVSNAGLKPIKDVSVDLSTTEILLERAQQFSLHEKLEFAASPNGEGAHLDSIKFEHKHEGSNELLNMFGLESATHKVGTVSTFAANGTILPSDVSYNQVILLEDNKRVLYEHYTRLGIGVNAAPRTKTKAINLKVSGGIIQPEAFFEIPDYVQLNDQGGINNTYAGVKATIGIKDAASSTDFVFDVTGDTNFKISNDKQDFYLVSLYNEDKSKMTEVGDKATVGTFDKNNRKKVVWFNTVKDIKRTNSIYEGTMTFYITSK